LALSDQFVSDPYRLTALEAAVDQVRNAPHPMLRAIHSLETAGGYDILVEEHVIGASLRDFLRSRGVFTAPEVVRLVSLLAPLADHASANGLKHVDLTLLGIHLAGRESIGSETGPDLLRRPLTAWEDIQPKVNAIDFSFSSSDIGPGLATREPGLATRMQSLAGSGPRGSEVRLLSLLAYELLGGPPSRVEETGQYTPITTLTQEGNAVLRRGLVDEYPSAAELARQLAAVVAVAVPSSEPIGPPKPPPDSPIKRTAREARGDWFWRWVSSLCWESAGMHFIGICSRRILRF
jgi:hypothetical protein